MSLTSRMAMPFLGIVVAFFALPLSAMAADDHSGHNMSEMDHSGHDTGSTAHIHHQHKAGGWMFEYKFMRMVMDGLLDGTDSVDPADVTGTMMMPGPYMMSPTEMTMDMHMFMVMYGLSDKISLMGMLHYMKKDMDMVSRMGPTSTMSSSGVGDTQLGVMYAVNDNVTTSISLSIPTGGIDEEDDMVMGGMVGTIEDAQLPYPMQLGSGTYDLIPSITYKTRAGHWDLGGQASYTYRIGENANEYALGNRLEATGWVKRKVDSVLLSARLNWSRWNNVRGEDPDLNPMMSPTADPDAQAGTRMDALLGISGMFGKGHMLGLEVGKPVMQNLDGPQMETETLMSVSYQYMSM